MTSIVGLRASLPSVNTGDVFSQKVGDWAFAVATPSTYNPRQDIPHGFCAQPIDGSVMDYLALAVPTTRLPVAHLYDGALASLTQKVDDPAVKALLQQDCELRDYLRARKLGDVYE
jgi:pyruvate/2-oxoacid:ferredoxin oxidoreductase alpha subunit